MLTISYSLFETFFFSFFSFFSTDGLISSGIYYPCMSQVFDLLNVEMFLCPKITLWFAMEMEWQESQEGDGNGGVALGQSLKLKKKKKLITMYYNVTL